MDKLLQDKTSERGKTPVVNCDDSKTTKGKWLYSQKTDIPDRQFWLQCKHRFARSCNQ